jgi:hypothetical protein
MIVDERLLTYLCSLDGGNGELLDAIEQEALADEVPIIRKTAADFGGWLCGRVFRPSDGAVESHKGADYDD